MVPSRPQNQTPKSVVWDSSVKFTTALLYQTLEVFRDGRCTTVDMVEILTANLQIQLKYGFPHSKLKDQIHCKSTRLLVASISSFSSLAIMRFEKQHAGKWVATRGEKVVDARKSLKVLMGRTSKRDDQAKVRYSLVPKGCMAGCSYGI